MGGTQIKFLSHSAGSETIEWQRGSSPLEPKDMLAMKRAYMTLRVVDGGRSRQVSMEFILHPADRTLWRAANDTLISRQSAEQPWLPSDEMLSDLG